MSKPIRIIVGSEEIERRARGVFPGVPVEIDGSMGPGHWRIVTEEGVAEQTFGAPTIVAAADAEAFKRGRRSGKDGPGEPVHPAPWRWDVDAGETTLEAANGETVLRGAFGYDVIAASPQVEALIAAAPEMLALLREVRVTREACCFRAKAVACVHERAGFLIDRIDGSAT